MVHIKSENNDDRGASSAAVRTESGGAQEEPSVGTGTAGHITTGDSATVREPRETAKRGRSYINQVTRMHRAGEWDDDDDATLLHAVNTFPVYKNYINWSRISREAKFRPPGRTAKACRERFFNALDPNLNKGPWSREEDDFIVEMQRVHGNRWATIARMLDTNRTDHTVKNRFNVLKRVRRIPDLPKPKRIKKSDLQAMRLAELMARRAAAAKEVEARHGMSMSELGLGGIGIGGTEAPPELLTSGISRPLLLDADGALPVTSSTHDAYPEVSSVSQARNKRTKLRETKAEGESGAKRTRTIPGSDTANVLLLLAADGDDGKAEDEEDE